MWEADFVRQGDLILLGRSVFIPESGRVAQRGRRPLVGWLAHLHGIVDTPVPDGVRSRYFGDRAHRSSDALGIGEKRDGA